MPSEHLWITCWHLMFLPYEVEFALPFLSALLLSLLYFVSSGLMGLFEEKEELRILASRNEDKKCYLTSLGFKIASDYYYCCCSTFLHFFNLTITDERKDPIECLHRSWHRKWWEKYHLLGFIVSATVLFLHLLFLRTEGLQIGFPIIFIAIRLLSVFWKIFVVFGIISSMSIETPSESRRFPPQ